MTDRQAKIFVLKELKLRARTVVAEIHRYLTDKESGEYSHLLFTKNGYAIGNLMEVIESLLAKNGFGYPKLDLVFSPLPNRPLNIGHEGVWLSQVHAECNLLKRRTIRLDEKISTFSVDHDPNVWHVTPNEC